MRSRQALLLVIACTFAAVDLVHKTLTPADVHHARTRFVALVMLLLIAGLVVLVPRIPSTTATIGAGIACGGALGNLVSLLAWRDGVPDPLMLVGDTHALAFNLADLFALSGDVLLLGATVLYGLKHREGLRERV